MCACLITLVYLCLPVFLCLCLHGIRSCLPSWPCVCLPACLAPCLYAFLPGPVSVCLPAWPRVCPACLPAEPRVFLSSRPRVCQPAWPFLPICASSCLCLLVPLYAQMDIWTVPLVLLVGILICKNSTIICFIPNLATPNIFFPIFYPFIFHFHKKQMRDSPEYIYIIMEVIVFRNPLEQYSHQGTHIPIY